MRDLVEFVARSLVDDAAAVRVRTGVPAEGEGLLIELVVAPADMGKVIGRQGRIARALRSVVRAAAVRHRVRVVLDIKSA
ncbi:MAG TPA: KH domain-containing protein [bacterium]|nr:KH domain-containing protein [bacterium]